jgi:hypothetical protein
MIVVDSFRQSEFRKRVTKAIKAILEILQHLPESQRRIFVWNRYRGYQPKQIAEMLRCDPSEIEVILDTIDEILYQRTRTLLEEGLQSDPEMGSPAISMIRGIEIDFHHLLPTTHASHQGQPNMRKTLAK